MTDRGPTFGQFITLEGTEGVGKSTNLDCVCAALDDANIPYHVTREPGGTELAEALRALLLEPREEPVTPIAELLMMFAARAQHIDNEIKPRLNQGQWVVCDRFTDATFAYQGVARGIALEKIEILEGWVQGELQPDLTILLDIDPHIAMERIADRPKDRLEQEQMAFFEAVRAGYLARAHAFNRFRVVDAGQILSDVEAQVRAHVVRFIAESIPESSTQSLR